MLAIIPARGGSKGLPNKNIKELNGKPMIAYTIEEAKKSKYITQIIVSTDSQEIAKIATSYGASIPFIRPAELATDTALAIDNYIYTIERLMKSSKNEISEFIVLQPTSPLRLAEDIDAAIELYHNKKADSVISYTKEQHPIIWHKYITEDNKFDNIFKDSLNNRQEERVSYYPNGSIFIFRYDLIKNRKYYSDKSFAYKMPRKRSIDIDTIEDFEYAEYLLKKRI